MQHGHLIARSSPRAWGCFEKRSREARDGEVFPTCVGVFLLYRHASRRPGSLPHVRGGVSQKAAGLRLRLRSSPRAWGCFSLIKRYRELFPVFPTCVGVFLHMTSRSGFFLGLPHVRGGVSCLILLSRFGVIVFPTCVGVFLFTTKARGGTRSLPHVRGGVSPYDLQIRILPRSSPRAWGCFPLFTCCGASGDVFPTCVGVFLKSVRLLYERGRLPHVRGGVSYVAYLLCGMEQSSPRAWGCFSGP